MTLGKEMVRQDLFPGTSVIDVRTSAGGLCSGGERLGSTPNTTRNSGTYNPGAGWQSVDGKLLRNIKSGAGGGFRLDITVFLLKAGQVD